MIWGKSIICDLISKEVISMSLMLKGSKWHEDTKGEKAWGCKTWTQGNKTWAWGHKGWKGTRVQDMGMRVQDMGMRVQDMGMRVQDKGVRHWQKGHETWTWRGQGVGARVWDMGARQRDECARHGHKGTKDESTYLCPWFTPSHPSGPTSHLVKLLLLDFWTCRIFATISLRILQ